VRHRLYLACTYFLLTTIAYSAETPIPPAPTEWVTDTANFLSPSVVQSLNERLEAYQHSTGHQLIVYIAPTTGDTPVEDWTVNAFAKWKVGRKGLDDGLALFIFPQDRKIRIEVGYGLEPVVPDVIASRIIYDEMAPRIRAGQPDAAVTAAVSSLIQSIGGESGAQPRPQESRSQPLSAFQWICLGILAILFLGFIVTHPALAVYFLTSILSGGGYRSGGSGGGGGFSGGGGRSGGGGATGSW